ncbi:MAG: hypothetical protein WBA10_06475 [Elainellaceae cyanobacterium]
MTDPSTNPTKTPTPARSRPARSGLRSVLVLIFRLLLLGVGSALALVIGILVAQMAPGSVDRQPLLEDLLRGVARFRGTPYPQVDPPDQREALDLPAADSADSVTLPDRPTSPDATPPRVTDAPGETNAPDGASTAEKTEPAIPKEPPSLQRSPTLRRELAQLRSEQLALEEAIAQLEAQVGIEPSTQSLDARIAELERRLSAAQPTPQPSPQN